MYPEKLKVIAQQVQLQQQQEQVRLLHQEKLEREQQHLRTQVSRRHLRGALRRERHQCLWGPASLGAQCPAHIIALSPPSSPLRPELFFSPLY